MGVKENRVQRGKSGQQSNYSREEDTECHAWDQPGLQSLTKPKGCEKHW